MILSQYLRMHNLHWRYYHCSANSLRLHQAAVPLQKKGSSTVHLVWKGRKDVTSLEPPTKDHKKREKWSVPLNPNRTGSEGSLRPLSPFLPWLFKKNSEHADIFSRVIAAASVTNVFLPHKFEFAVNSLLMWLNSAAALTLTSALTQGSKCCSRHDAAGATRQRSKLRKCWFSVCADSSACQGPGESVSSPAKDLILVRSSSYSSLWLQTSARYKIN